MKRFIERTLEKLDKVSPERMRLILQDISSENELLEMVLNSMSDGVVVADKDHRIMLFNKSSERLVPFISGDLIARYVWDAIEDREIASFVRDLLEAQETIWDREFTLNGGSGKTIACSILPLVRDGSIQGSLMHVEDVTEKRANEARLRRAESLAALTTLTAGVAHEIKNPLGSISIHIQLMQKEMRGKKTIKPKKIVRYLEILNEEVDRLNMIVVDFLFAVRPMDAKPIRQDLNQVIRDIMEFLEVELTQAGVELTFDLCEIPKISLDEKYIKQALINLIKNALAAMPNGGVLTIRTRMDRDHVYLDVVDTGVGILEENMDKIFEPYFTTKDFSSGLGLTLVFKIAKEHGGEIAVKSKRGAGTTFTMSFSIPQSEKRLIKFAGGANEV